MSVGGLFVCMSLCCSCWMVFIRSFIHVLGCRRERSVLCFSSRGWVTLMRISDECVVVSTFCISIHMSCLWLLMMVASLGLVVLPQLTVFQSPSHFILFSLASSTSPFIRLLHSSSSVPLPVSSQPPTETLSPAFNSALKKLMAVAPLSTSPDPLQHP